MSTRATKREPGRAYISDVQRLVRKLLRNARCGKCEEYREGQAFSCGSCFHTFCEYCCDGACCPAKGCDGVVARSPTAEIVKRATFITCPNGCLEELPLASKEAHIREDCPQRDLECMWDSACVCTYTSEKAVQHFITFHQARIFPLDASEGAYQLVFPVDKVSIEQISQGEPVDLEWKNQVVSLGDTSFLIKSFYAEDSFYLTVTSLSATSSYEVRVVIAELAPLDQCHNTCKARHVDTFSIPSLLEKKKGDIFKIDRSRVTRILYVSQQIRVNIIISKKECPACLEPVFKKIKLNHKNYLPFKACSIAKGDRI